MKGVSAILLAAGESRRVGAANKLLLLRDGVPMVRHAARVLLASQLGEVVVVVGHDAERVTRALDGLQVSTVRNDAYRQGQMTSVYAGLGALRREGGGVMVCLADQPLLTAEDVNRLIDAFIRGGQGGVVVPTFRGQRGNPIVIDGAHLESILSGRRNLGCRHFIDSNPDLVTTVEWESDHVVVDIDTAADAARWTRGTANTARQPERLAGE